MTLMTTEPDITLTYTAPCPSCDREVLWTAEHFVEAKGQRRSIVEPECECPVLVGA